MFMFAGEDIVAGMVMLAGEDIGTGTLWLGARPCAGDGSKGSFDILGEGIGGIAGVGYPCDEKAIG